MNKDIERIIENTRQVDTYIMSSNGYDMYDLMVDLQPGYLTASNTLFYSEDKKVIEKLEAARSEGITEVKKFLTENSQHLMKMRDIEKNFGAEQLDHQTAMAVKHLLTKEARKDTFKKGRYGAQHLIIGNEILIFPAQYGLKNEDLNDTLTYQKAQIELKKQYEEGIAKPNAKITGHLFERLYEALLNVNINNLTEHQKNKFTILTDFSQQYKDLKIELNVIGNKSIISLSRNDLLIDFELPKEPAEFNYMGKPEKYKFYEFLIEIHKTLLNQEVKDLQEKSTSGLQNFMKKLKL